MRGYFKKIPGVRMKKIISSILAGSIALMFAVAQELAASTDDPGIQKRETNQQRRIDQGIDSRQITPKEAEKLDSREGKIKKDEARMKSDGKLTKKERAELTKKAEQRQ
jgi:hypothetical protein